MVLNKPKDSYFSSVVHMQQKIHYSIIIFGGQDPLISFVPRIKKENGSLKTAGFLTALRIKGKMKIHGSIASRKHRCT